LPEEIKKGITGKGHVEQLEKPEEVEDLIAAGKPDIAGASGNYQVLTPDRALDLTNSRLQFMEELYDDLGKKINKKLAKPKLKENIKELLLKKEMELNEKIKNLLGKMSETEFTTDKQFEADKEAILKDLEVIDKLR